MDITKEYNIYCDVCGKSQPFSADFETDWTDLICVECRVIVATFDKKIKSNNF